MRQHKTKTRKKSLIVCIFWANEKDLNKNITNRWTKGKKNRKSVLVR